MKSYLSSLLFVLLVFGCERLQKKFRPELQEQQDFGAISYDWSMKSLAGERVDFGAFRGKVVFLNFWATWCGPCILELPAIQRMYDSLKTSNVRFVLVTSEKPEVVQDFMKENDLDIPVYLFDERPPLILRPEGLPTTFVIDATGRIVYKHRGFAMYGDVFLRSLRDISVSSANEGSGYKFE